MPYSVTLIPGDGIGPEITDATLLALEATGIDFHWDRQTAGALAMERRGDPLPSPALESIRVTRCALKGPLETPLGGGYRSVNVALRKEFGLYANLRPVKTVIPFRSYHDIDVIMVRENTQGLYAGVEHFVQVGDDPHAVAESTAITTREGCSRIIRFAFEYAVHHSREKVTLVHKANILKMVSGLFLEEGRNIAKEFEGRVACDEKIIDNAAMQLVMKPEEFDVIVTTNMFGDILSDLAAGLVGGMGMAPSADIGDRHAVFQPSHGSAPDIAGKGIANPIATILSVALMLDWLGTEESKRGAAMIRRAVETVLSNPDHRTADLGGHLSTRAMGDQILEQL